MDSVTVSSFVSRQLSANRGASVSHVTLQPNVAVLVHRGGEELRGGHVVEASLLKPNGLSYELGLRTMSVDCEDAELRTDCVNWCPLSNPTPPVL